MKNLNKLVNRDMIYLSNWLSTNKIFLKVEKTELAIFKSPRKILLDEMKIKLGGKRKYPSNSVKNFVVRIDKFLHRHDQVNKIAVKVNDTLKAFKDFKNKQQKFMKELFLI